MMDNERRMSSPSSASSSLAAKAIRASSAHRDSSLSAAYSSPSSAPLPTPPKEVKPHEYTSMKSLNEPKRSFWGSLASKAKAFLDEDDPHQLPPSPKTTDHEMPSGTKEAAQTGRKIENPSLQRSLDAISS